MLSEQQQRIMGYFIEEAKDHLNTIEQGLLNLQSTMTDPEMVSEVFRAAHSVKGGAAMLGLNSIQRVSHRLEDFFKVLKECPIQVDRKLENLLFNVFDALKELLDQLQGPFGLTDDKAAEVMAGVEPVFQSLGEHLGLLVSQCGGVLPEEVELPQPVITAVAATPAVPPTQAARVQPEEASALQLIFQSDVPSCLRDMLQLFKQSENAITRQQLQDICQNLKQAGEQFDLSAWTELTTMTRQAIANPDNTYRALAPIIIKSIKQAQELVLSGRASEISISESLRALVPAEEEPVTSPSFDELLAAIDAEDEGEPIDLIDFAGEEDFELSEDLTAEPVEMAELSDTVSGGINFFDDSSFIQPDEVASDLDLGFDAIEELDRTESNLSISDELVESLEDVLSDHQGPEVGLAELNSLADLFEGEVPDLGMTWQEEQVLGTSDIIFDQSEVLDGSNDFSDLLFDQEGLEEELILEEEIEEEDLSGLLNRTELLSNEANRSEPLSTDAIPDISSQEVDYLASDLSFDLPDTLTDDLFADSELSLSSEIDTETTENLDDLGLFSLNLNEVEGDREDNSGDLAELFAGLEEIDLESNAQTEPDTSPFDISADANAFEMLEFNESETIFNEEDDELNVIETPTSDSFFDNLFGEPTTESTITPEPFQDLDLGDSLSSMFEEESSISSSDLDAVFEEESSISSSDLDAVFEEESSISSSDLDAVFEEESSISSSDLDAVFEEEFSISSSDLDAVFEEEFSISSSEFFSQSHEEVTSDLWAEEGNTQKVDSNLWTENVEEFQDIFGTTDLATKDLTVKDLATENVTTETEHDTSSAFLDLPAKTDALQGMVAEEQDEALEDLFSESMRTEALDLTLEINTEGSDELDNLFTTSTEDDFSDENFGLDADLDNLFGEDAITEASDDSSQILSDADIASVLDDVNLEGLFGEEESEASFSEDIEPALTSLEALQENAPISDAPEDVLDLSNLSDSASENFLDINDSELDFGFESNDISDSMGEIDMSLDTDFASLLDESETSLEMTLDTDTDVSQEDLNQALLDFVVSESESPEASLANNLDSIFGEFTLNEGSEVGSEVNESLDVGSFLESTPDNETFGVAEIDAFSDLDALLSNSEDSSQISSLSDSLRDQATEDFSDLEALLGETEPVIGTSAREDAEDSFADLEALLTEEAFLAETSVPTTSPGLELQAPPISELSEFDDLEKLLEDADQTLGGTPTSRGARVPALTSNRRPSRRGSGVLTDQTMRVSVKNLDNLNNLVGELVVNRNSLEQAEERLRQFLDNLLYQVQQLSDVGQRMRDLYERSLLESSLLSSRKSYQMSIQGSTNIPDSQAHSTGVSFDALEMDRFTGFHTLSQEMIELIVRVRESASDIDFVVDETDQITRNFRQITTQLQEGLTRARMVPFAQTADRLPRAVRDISIKCGKQAELVIEGRETLIDKMILEQLYDPMTHLVNNAITHGIETPDERSAAGKPATGRIIVRTFHQGNQTVISVTDDGAGIDPEIVKRKATEKGLITAAQAAEMTRLDVYDLLFHHGFSTRDKADDFAGRGVGMDVVRTSLNEIRGVINIDSTIGRGTTFTIRLPLTLSISKALCCISNRARIAFPMDGVEDMLDVPKERILRDDQARPCIQWRDTLLPFQPLSELLRYNRSLGRGSVYGGNQEDDIVSVVVLRSAGNFLALQVDQVLGEQEIVIKQLEGPVPKPIGVAGATVLGDGRIMPIADVLELIDLSMGRIRRDVSTSLWEKDDDQVPTEPVDTKTEPTVLIVDDSITVRELLSMTFNKVGYRVEQARDGQEAWEKLRSGLPCDLVFCDIEMPRMDGLELLSRIQKDGSLNHLPIAMLTSRGADRHRQMAIQLGAKGYFTKPYLEEALLDAAQRMLRGEVLVG
jgi:chemosensory pili system protein ChpA (sensor histidine kinase/response regulator)